MTIYVDSSFIQAKVGPYKSRWCHLFSDSLDPEELHEFIEKLGLKRRYFQHTENKPEFDHYDVTLGKRKQAIRLGAIPINCIRAVEIWREKRNRYKESARSSEPSSWFGC